MKNISMQLMGLAYQREELEDVIKHFSDQAIICELDGCSGQASKFWDYVYAQRQKLEALDKKLSRIGIT